MLQTANIDKSESMQQFLKPKVIKELAKGVATFRDFIYPSVLQSAAIPALKKNPAKNVIVKYSELSGIKLTVLLPLLNQQIKYAIKEAEEDKVIYSLVICNSNKRCGELYEFCQQLTTYCKDVVDLVMFEHLDFKDCKHEWKQRVKRVESGDQEEQKKMDIKVINKVVFLTPMIASSMFDHSLLSKKNAQCFGIVLDKVNMHQAFDLDENLIELAQNDNYPKSKDIAFKTIFTTNVKGDEKKSSSYQDEAQRDNYLQIKKSFMGKESGKSLIIQLSEEQRQLQSFEVVNHYYVMCKNDKDKYLMLFALKKLSMIQGKLAVYANDIIQAYRLKFFFNRFHMKAFVVSPDMAKQQVASILHFFSIGQFDIVILLNQGYKEEEKPVLKDLSYVVNFELPETYTTYRETGSQISVNEGAIINLVTPEEEKQNGMLATYSRKMEKAFGRQDILRCIPIIWHEVVKMKGRVEEVLSTLSNKRVRDEKLLEFKKQVVSNKSLKEYFKSNP